MPDRPAGAVLITRPEPGASETAARITDMGFEPILAPVIVIEPLLPRLPGPDRVAGLVITSRNAIEAIPAALRRKPAWAVGAATARLARQAGFADVHGADGDAAALAALIGATADATMGPLLLVTAAGQGRAICQMLRERGFRVIRRVGYRTRPAARLDPLAAEALLAGRVATALFFSAESARMFIRLLCAGSLGGAVATCDAVAISPAVGVALRSLAWRRIQIAATPTQDSMLAFLS